MTHPLQCCERVDTADQSVGSIAMANRIGIRTFSKLLGKALDAAAKASLLRRRPARFRIIGAVGNRSIRRRQMLVATSFKSMTRSLCSPFASDAGKITTPSSSLMCRDSMVRDVALAFHL